MLKRSIKTIVVMPRWQPTPLPEPHIDRHLTQRNAIERSAIVPTFWCMKAEHWISPGGSLREWIRLNAYAALFVAIPTFIIVPIITALLTQFVTWTALLGVIIKNLVMAQCLARQGLRPGRHTSGVRESFVFARSEALPAKGLFFVRRWLKKGGASGRAARSRGGGTGF
jgi:hypothetical protein